MTSVSPKAATLTLAAFAVLAGALPAGADGRDSRFNITFPFVVGNQLLPAGRYELELDDFGRLYLKNLDQGSSRYLPVSAHYEKRPVSELGSAKLKFNRYGETMFLWAAWSGVEEDGRVVVCSQRMVAAAQKAAPGSGPTTLTLVASLR